MRDLTAKIVSGRHGTLGPWHFALKISPGKLKGNAARTPPRAKGFVGKLFAILKSF